MFQRLPAVLIFWAVVATAAHGQVPDLIFRTDLTQKVMVGDRSTDRTIGITLTADALVIVAQGRLSIPYAAIKSMTYDRRSKVRVMAYKIPQVQHFLTIQYRLGDVGDVVEIEMGKNVAPKLVSQLEARSGQKIDRTGG